MLGENIDAFTSDHWSEHSLVITGENSIWFYQTHLSLKCLRKNATFPNSLALVLNLTGLFCLFGGKLWNSKHRGWGLGVGEGLGCCNSVRASLPAFKSTKSKICCGTTDQRSHGTVFRIRKVKRNLSKSPRLNPYHPNPGTLLDLTTKVRT